MKYILNWKEKRDEKGNLYAWEADTEIGHYLALDCFIAGTLHCFWEFRQQGDPVSSKHCKQGTARFEAEQDYTRRCSQHLEVVLPEHVQVSKDDLILLVNACDSNRVATKEQQGAAERVASLLGKPL